MTDADSTHGLWSMTSEDLISYMATNVSRPHRIEWARAVLEARTAIANERAAASTARLVRVTAWLVAATFTASVAAVSAAVVG
jgi:hypothetical protein